MAPFRSILALAVAVLVWGTTFVISSDLLESVSPAALIAVRFAMAALVLVSVAAASGGLLVAVRRPSTALFGLTGVAGYFGLQNVGLALHHGRHRRVAAGRATGGNGPAGRGSARRTTTSA